MTGRRHRGPLVALVTGALLTAGCSLGASPADRESPPRVTVRADGEWTLVQESVDGEVVEVPPGRVTLTLEGPGGWGFAGCNEYRFQATVSDGRISIDGGIATTKRLCRAPGVMEGEERYLGLLGSMTSIEQFDGRLRLTGANRALEYVRND
jgi:heat shock protein HslJ